MVFGVLQEGGVGSGPGGPALPPAVMRRYLPQIAAAVVVPHPLLWSISLLFLWQAYDVHIVASLPAFQVFHMCLGLL